NPAFGQLRVFDFDGNSRYNSFQLNLSRRFNRGFQLQGAYSYSRSIDDSSNNTAIDSSSSANGVSESGDFRYLDRGLSGFDVRHFVSANATYELPFGSGKRWLPAKSGVMSKIVSGWQATTILSGRTGLPVNILNGFDRSASQAGTDLSGRPNLAPGR